MDPITFAQLNAAYHKGVYGQEETLDIQEWVEVLIEEGYDLDEYTDDELYEAYLADSKNYAGMSGQRLARVMGKVADLSRTSQRFASDTNVISQARRAGHTDKDVKQASQEYADRADKIISRIGKHDPEKVKARETQNRKTINVRATPVSGPSLAEELDLYDLVSEYLVSEGFCDSYEDADVIMANMSEEWRESILDEAEKVFPLRKVADKTNELRQRIKDSKSSEEREKLLKRMKKMDDEYWQPN
jgi:hypothetical protein